MLSLIPAEILVKIFSYLNAADLHSISKCSRFMHLVSSHDELWRQLCYFEKNITFKPPEYSWKFLFFQNLDTVCRHLNKLNPNLVNQKQQLMHQLFHTPAVSCSGCQITLPDLWMCLEMDCMRIGCGRTKQKHAYQHGTDAGHHLSMKTTNLELWCYVCKKYVGSVDAHPVERYIVNYFAGLILSTQGLPQWVHQQWQLNDRRQHERKLHGISKQDTLLFIDIVWLRQWREFLAGNAMPPGPLDNTALVNNGALNPDISLNIDFEIIAERHWNALHRIYGGGPMLGEKEINAEQYRFIRVGVQGFKRWLSDFRDRVRT